MWEELIVMERNIYCWNECMDKDTGYNVIMQPIVIGDEDCMFCPDCYKIWDLTHDQIPPKSPHKQKMDAISRLIKAKKENPELYED